jgi:hypothetical protein
MKNEKPYPFSSFICPDYCNDYNDRVLLRNKIMSATSPAEVNQIRDTNLDFLNVNPRLFTFTINARKRLNNLRKEKILNENIIYLN